MLTQLAFTCSKLTNTTPKLWFSYVLRRIERRRSGVFIVNFERTSHIVLVFLLWNLSK